LRETTVSLTEPGLRIWQSGAGKVLPIIEGRRTEAGGLEGSLQMGVLLGLKEVLKLDISPTSLLRLLVLCTRTECRKTQANMASITEVRNEA
jgi:hypothetical protein